MSSPLPAEEDTVQAKSTRLKRWEFRKKKKLEKRRKRRQLNAEKIKSSIPPPPPTIEPTENEDTIAEKQKYERDKALWEEREQKFKAIELAKKAAKEKEEKAKALSQVHILCAPAGSITQYANLSVTLNFNQKRWKDTLLNLPLMPRNFTANTNQKNVINRLLRHGRS